MKTNKVQSITPDEPTVHALAQQAMSDAGGDLQQASEALERLANESPPVWMTLTAKLIRQACYDAVRGVNKAERAHIWLAPNYDPGGNSERLIGFSQSLMDFPLPGGLRLREANKAELLDAADFYTKQAKNMADKGAWLTLIADRVGRGTVGKKLTEDKLIELKEGL